MSGEATKSTPAEGRIVHPALVYLALAMGAFERSGFTEDADAFMEWSICHFDQVEFMKAFTKQKEELPPFTTIDADHGFARSCIKKVGRELNRRMLQEDTLGLWIEELNRADERQRKRRQQEAEKEEMEKAEEERRDREEANKCSTS